MAKDKTITDKQLIKKIVAALNEMDGDDLARTANEILDAQHEYVGGSDGSAFREVKIENIELPDGGIMEHPSDKDIELSDGGVIEYPEEDTGIIRRRDKDGNCEEIRRPEDENYWEWEQLFDFVFSRSKIK